MKRERRQTKTACGPEVALGWPGSLIYSARNMKILRRRVRRAFLYAAVTFIVLAGLLISRASVSVERWGAVPFAAATFGCALLGLLYGMAWYTTRQPSEYRNNWAVAASGLSLIWGLVMAAAAFRLRPGDFAYAIPGIATLLTGGAGLYLYAPGGSPYQPGVADGAVTKSTTGFVPPPASGRRPSTLPTAVAPSIAALRGSSPEIVASMEPNAAWDPLMALRTPETVKKLRT